MANSDTPNTEQERAADVITAQPILVQCGEKEYTLTPRTPHQLRAITKYLAKYNRDMADALLGMMIGKSKTPITEQDSKNEDANTPITEQDDENKKIKTQNEINDDALDSVIVLVQMLLDDKKTFDAKTPIITTEEIENNMDFGQINNVINEAADMHDIKALISQTQRLRVI